MYLAVTVIGRNHMELLREGVIFLTALACGRLEAADRRALYTHARVCACVRLRLSTSTHLLCTHARTHACVRACVRECRHMQLQSRQAKAQCGEEGRLVVDALALVLVLPMLCV